MAEIRVLRPADEATLETLLLSHLESSLVMLHMLRSADLVNNGQPEQCTFAGVFADDHLVGAAALDPDGMLHLQSSVSQYELYEAALNQSQGDVTGIQGPKEQVSILEESWGFMFPTIRQTRIKKVYSLDLERLVEPELLLTGKVLGRRIQFQEVEQIALSCMELPLIGDQPIDGRDARSAIERMARERRLWVLKHRGELVASLGFGVVLPEAVQIIGVSELPGLTNDDYCSCVIAAALLEARADGIRLAVMELSEESAHLQKPLESLGFRQAGHEHTLVLKSSVIL